MHLQIVTVSISVYEMSAFNLQRPHVSLTFKKYASHIQGLWIGTPA
jgi:hypothetical protein